MCECLIFFDWPLPKTRSKIVSQKTHLSWLPLTSATMLSDIFLRTLQNLKQKFLSILLALTIRKVMENEHVLFSLHLPNVVLRKVY